MSKGAALLVSGIFLIIISSAAYSGWLALGFLLTAFGLRSLYDGQKSLVARVGALEALVRQMRVEALLPAESAVRVESPSSEPSRKEVQPAGESLPPIAITPPVTAAASEGEPTPLVGGPVPAPPLPAFTSIHEAPATLSSSDRPPEAQPDEPAAAFTVPEAIVVHHAAYEVRQPLEIARAGEGAGVAPLELLQRDLPPPIVEPPVADPPASVSEIVQPENADPIAMPPVDSVDPATEATDLPPLVTAEVPRAEPRMTPPPPRPAVAPAKAARSLVDIEQLLGVNWLSKVGVAILVIGISFFLAWQLRELGPLGKDVVGTIVGITMLGAGIRAERNERYRILARAVLAGGWALLFFISYAAHHVTAARVIDSTVGALLLMLLVAGAMVIHTLRYRSQVVTALAFSLAFVTLAINRADAASLSANVILAVGFSVVVVRMRWYGLEIIGIAATYLNHYMWMRPMLRGGTESFPEIYTSATILVIYWVIFRASFALRRAPDEKTSVMAGMLNSALLLVVLKFHGLPPERAFWPLLVLGLLELGIARLPRVRERRSSFVALTTIGVALIGAAIPFRFAPDQVTWVWLIDAILFTAVGIITAEPVYRRLGTIVAAATAIQLLIFPIARLFGTRFSGGVPEHEWSIGLICLAVAGALHAESLWLPRRWPALFAHRFDRRAADVFGYVAVGIAMLGGWALFPAIGTAVFWGALALVLTFVNRLLPAASGHLSTQAAAATACAFARVILVNLPSATPSVAAAALASRVAAVVAVAALLYAISRFSSGGTEISQRVNRIVGAWGGTVVLALLVSYELPRLSIAIGWTAIAVALLTVARRIDLPHLGLQANVVAAIAVVQFVLVNLPTGDGAVTEPLRLTWRVITAVVLAGFVYVLSRRNGDDPLTSERWCSVLPLWVGSSLLAVLPWFEMRTPFVTLAWTAFVIALAVLGRRFSSIQLAWQANLLAAVAFARVLIVDLNSSDAAMTAPFLVTWRLLTTASLVAVFYLLSYWNSSGELAGNRFFKAAPSWAAATLLVLLAWAEIPQVGVVLAWTILGFLFAAIGQRLQNGHLTAQANAVAGVALAKALWADLASPALLFDAPVRLTWHAVTISGVAALFYALSHWNAKTSDPPAGHATVPRAIASGLVLLLAWHELISPAVLVAWSVAGFALLFIGRRYRIADLAIHAYFIALLAIARIVTVNLPSSAVAFSTPLEVSWRMIGVPLAAALFYSLARWNPFQALFAGLPESWFTATRRAAVSRSERASNVLPLVAGSVALVLLAWYQLLSASVVLAWTILAMILMELGLRRSSRDLLLQAQVLFFACVARLFAVNMNIEDGGAIGARVFTIVPVVIALLYAYDRLYSVSPAPRWLSPAYAWCAVISLAALLRFQLAADAVVLGWATLTVGLVAVAAYSGRRVFLHIGMALAVASFTRAIMHNLYERSYFPSPGAFDTWLFVGATAVILFASLPFAFRARFAPPAAQGHPLLRAVRWIDAKPEQILFFVPLLLVTVLIATDMRRGMLTVAWGLEAVAVFVFALWVRERTFRLAGIGLLLLCVGKVFLLDFWSLTLRDKALTGIIMGLALIGVSLLYTRNRETILKFL